LGLRHIDKLLIPLSERLLFRCKWLTSSHLRLNRDELIVLVLLFRCRLLLEIRDRISPLLNLRIGRRIDSAMNRIGHCVRIFLLEVLWLLFFLMLFGMKQRLRLSLFLFS